jgi:putative Holliday junction resolvase
MCEGGRVLAVDWGRRRIGLAVSDPLGITAQGLPTLEVFESADPVEAVARVVRDREAGRVIVGLPKNMDGTEGDSAVQARRFGERLRELCQVEVVFWDERLSSVQAGRVLREGSRKERRDKGLRDQVAAQLILQGYLASPAAGDSRA